MDGIRRISQASAYGRHISLLCKCGVGKYHTKNIDFIGARSIFPIIPCDCPSADLAPMNP